MDGMESIRKVLRDMGYGLLSISGSDRWTQLEAAIVKARSGEDDICAALRELATSQGEMELHLFDNGSGHIHHRTDYDGGKERLVSWHDLREAASAIRSLIPKPVPTLEELLDTVEQSMHCHIDSTLSMAFARIRKLIPEQ